MGSQESRPNWTLIFQHLPKTGGITFSHVILQNIPRKEVFHIRSPEFKKAPYFSDDFGPLEEFVSLPEDVRSRYSCVLGHLQFGLHSHLPGPAKYVTILRDPVERILSHHGQYNAMVYNQEMGSDAKPLSLEDFMRLKSANSANMQGRFTIGEDFDMMADADRFNRAKENLKKHYVLIGTMERFNETVLVLCKLMGWSPEGFLQHNVGTLRSRVEEHPPELIEQIRRNNGLDTKLHACANEFLDRAIAGYGPGFQTHRIELERANKRKRKRAVLIARVKSVGKIFFGE